MAIMMAMQMVVLTQATDMAVAPIMQVLYTTPATNKGTPTAMQIVVTAIRMLTPTMEIQRQTRDMVTATMTAGTIATMGIDYGYNTVKGLR